MSLFLELQKNNKNTPIEKTIIDYVCQNPHKVLNMTMEEFSKNTYTSRSTISRFCKKNGYVGFNDFKVNLAMELNIRLIDYDARDISLPYNNKEDSEEEVIRKVTKTNIDAVLDGIRINSNKKIKEVATLIENAENVVFLGLQHSGIVANDAHIRMSLIGLSSKYFVTENEILSYAYYSNPKDVVILISYSGTTATIIEAAKYCKQNNSTLICITSNTENELSKYCDICLYVESCDQGEVNWSISSMMATLNIVLVLFCIILKRKQSQGNKYLADVSTVYKNLYKR